MTPEQLSSIAGILLSLVFSYIPGLSARFAALDGSYKRLVMLLMLVIVACSVFGLSCAGLIPGVACDRTSALGLLSSFVAALVANQSAFSLTPRSQA